MLLMAVMQVEQIVEDVKEHILEAKQKVIFILLLDTCFVCDCMIYSIII